MTDTITIKIHKSTRQRLKLLAVHSGETMMDLIDRLAKQEENQTMNSKQAATRIIRIDSTNERVELRAGAKGTGKVLWQCNYWPDSARSVEQMEEMLSNFVSQNDIELIDDPHREDFAV